MHEPEKAELDTLEEINNEITSLENRLQELPGTDIKSYNRKQRRQIERRMKSEEAKKMKQLEQKGNTYVTRKEFVGLFQSAQKLRDRLYYVDVLSAAMEKLLIEKNIITGEELKNYIKEENSKAQAFQEIQKGEKDYENRIKKCLELNIDPNISVIGQQIYEDPDIALADKIKLAEEYKLTTLSNIFKAQMEQKSNNDNLG